MCAHQQFLFVKNVRLTQIGKHFRKFFVLPNTVLGFHIVVRYPHIFIFPFRGTLIVSNLPPMTIVNVSKHEFLVETNDGTGASETGHWSGLGSWPFGCWG